MAKDKWPLKYKLWHYAHSLVNRIAWRLVPTKDYKDPRNKHWLWRLNNWVAGHYTHWYVHVWIRRHRDR